MATKTQKKAIMDRFAKMLDAAERSIAAEPPVPPTGPLPPGAKRPFWPPFPTPSPLPLSFTCANCLFYGPCTDDDCTRDDNHGNCYGTPPQVVAVAGGHVSFIHTTTEPSRPGCHLHPTILSMMVRQEG
jgi:hypothetical protein